MHFDFIISSLSSNSHTPDTYILRSYWHHAELEPLQIDCMCCPPTSLLISSICSWRQDSSTQAAHTMPTKWLSPLHSLGGSLIYIVPMSPIAICVLSTREMISKWGIFPWSQTMFGFCLVRFLDEVQSHSNENKMSVQNLATVFGPNILRPRVEDPVTMMEGKET